MPRDRWSDRWESFPPSRPLPVEGGIATRKQRGAMAESWWSQRFVEVLESFGLGGRMQRGRRYARAGQVTSLDVNPGSITALVQGSRREPYVVTVRMAVPSTTQWELISDEMRERVGFVARLLDGDVPPALEDTFAAAGVPLFPSMWDDLDADCTCPDWGNPCKHIAAVLYVFADKLDDDPWLLLAWRGRSREDVLAPLRGRPGARRADHGLPAWWPLAPGVGDVGGRGGAALLDAALTEPADPPDAVLARLEPLPVDVRGVPVTDLLRPAYEALATPTDDEDG